MAEKEAKKEEERRRGKRPRRAIGWVVGVALAAIIGNYVVPGAHRAIAAGACYAKLALHPGAYTPPSKAWTAFGVTSITRLAHEVIVSPAPGAGATDEWFGAVLAVTQACNYKVSFRAELLGPRDRADLRVLGYGYGIGARGTAVNGIPDATTVQFEPTFNGIRIVPVPGAVDAAGFNATHFANVAPGVFARWTMDIVGSTDYVNFDGHGYQALHLTSGNEILIRVWNAGVVIRGLTITPMWPSPP
jgi:hypothetical protein